MRYMAIAVFLVACSGGFGDNSSDEPARAPAQTLRDAGFACTAHADSGEAYTLTDESCEVEGETVSLYTFKDAGARANWYDSIKTITCGIFADSTFFMIEKQLAVIAPESETLARKISDAIDGSIYEITC